MRALWRYIQTKDNRELLAFLGGGLAAVVAGGWIAYTHFSKKEPPDKLQVTISAPGGVAGQNFNNSPVSVGSQAPAAPK